MKQLLSNSQKFLKPENLLNIGRGIEKEGLRFNGSNSSGKLSLTSHPENLGSALTNPFITTDFSESQLEFITKVHKTIDSCLDELQQIHQFTYRCLNNLEKPELIWTSSMPCKLSPDENIPIAFYGSSNIGRAKSIYRTGLTHRYGRRMQTISGIHYNWSFPNLSSEDYLSLIRNFRRYAFLLLYLFGASPAVCSCFVQGRTHNLQKLNPQTLYLPFATSLRMGDLGYQSQAQSNINISYNNLNDYIKSIYSALTTDYEDYKKIGIKNLGGDYLQLNTSLLQIENEFYSTIRPKRTIKSGERPLNVLKEKGIEYIEVRLMDLNPFENLGISKSTIQFLDLFLLFCLIKESPKDSILESQEIIKNQQLIAEQGRKENLILFKNSQEILFQTWALEILEEIKIISETLDKTYNLKDLNNSNNNYQNILLNSKKMILNSELTPSAKIIKEIKNFGSFYDFGFNQSKQIKENIMNLNWTKENQDYFEKIAQNSIKKQIELEKNNQNLDFETWRLNYLNQIKLI